MLVPRVLEILSWTVLSSHPKAFNSRHWALDTIPQLPPLASNKPNSQTPLSCPKRWNGCRDWEGQKVLFAPAVSRAPAQAAQRPWVPAFSVPPIRAPPAPPHSKGVSGSHQGQLPVNFISFQVSLPPSLIFMHNT